MSAIIYFLLLTFVVLSSAVNNDFRANPIQRITTRQNNFAQTLSRARNDKITVLSNRLHLMDEDITQIKKLIEESLTLPLNCTNGALRHGPTDVYDSPVFEDSQCYSTLSVYIGDKFNDYTKSSSKYSVFVGDRRYSSAHLKNFGWVWFRVGDLIIIFTDDSDSCAARSAEVRSEVICN